MNDAERSIDALLDASGLSSYLYMLSVAGVDIKEIRKTILPHLDRIKEIIEDKRGASGRIKDSERKKVVMRGFKKAAEDLADTYFGEIALGEAEVAEDDDISQVREKLLAFAARRARMIDRNIVLITGRRYSAVVRLSKDRWLVECIDSETVGKIGEASFEMENSEGGTVSGRVAAAEEASRLLFVLEMREYAYTATYRKGLREGLEAGRIDGPEGRTVEYRRIVGGGGMRKYRRKNVVPYEKRHDQALNKYLTAQNFPETEGGDDKFRSSYIEGWEKGWKKGRRQTKDDPVINDTGTHAPARTN